MNKVFRLYVPGDSPMHRLGVGWKYALMAAMVLGGVLVARWWLTLALLAVAVALVALTRVGLGYGLRLPLGVIVLVAVLFGYQAWAGSPFLGVVVAGNLVMALYASRMLTVSTPEAVLVDALITAAGCLRVFGVRPEPVGLAVGIMVKSIPMLLDSLTLIRQAAAARGRGSNVFAIMGPFVVRAVGYAQATGAALAARGLGE